ncbi:hypothetical protein HQ587_09365 [bacterium]|nr:hypothetical protein [bacterium]
MIAVTVVGVLREDGDDQFIESILLPPGWNTEPALQNPLCMLDFLPDNLIASITFLPGFKRRVTWQVYT